MSRSRREFTPEYKDEAVTGSAVAAVARELGVNEATLGRWAGGDPYRKGCASQSRSPRCQLRTHPTPREAGTPATTGCFWGG
ncbi:hypothetical protein C3B59_06285 [Cryobacterium zongtaii]|uniref:Transposase n=1 Tax=Cryobacterium zongtaii TaxID=1259217 RepID=A0A2S3ZK34_9MICO|nr:hypothetical protein C3B59_06285 [Cryobacterium zongtaii]